MKPTRTLGASLVIASALALIGVSTAAASEPEFKPGNKLIDFTFTSGTTIIATTGNILTCASDVGSGSVTGTDTVANVHLSFSKCTITTSSGTCVIQSIKPQGTAGLIDFNTLKGELGTVRVAEAASLVGVLLEPESGTVYTTLEKTTCSVETAATGKLAGEVSPVRTSQRLGAIKFATNASGAQAIKEIDELGKGFVEIPTLKFFGGAAALSSTENLQFAEAVEVT